MKIKKVTVKVFAPTGERRRQLIILAPKGKEFTPDGLYHLQRDMAAKVEEAFPGHDYRFVPTGSRSFNFVHEDNCGKCHVEAVAGGEKLPTPQYAS